MTVEIHAIRPFGICLLGYTRAYAESGFWDIWLFPKTDPFYPKDPAASSSPKFPKRRARYPKQSQTCRTLRPKPITEVSVV